MSWLLENISRETVLVSAIREAVVVKAAAKSIKCFIPGFVPLVTEKSFFTFAAESRIHQTSSRAMSFDM